VTEEVDAPKNTTTPAQKTRPTPHPRSLKASGDIEPGDGELRVRLEPLSAPRRTQALAAFCQQLNTTQTRYPGTSLILRYEVKPSPRTA
jgi:hypothetical protein